MDAYEKASEERRRAALEAADAALFGTALAQKAEPFLNAVQLAGKLGLNKTTVWRWAFPFHVWAGQKRYKLSECEAYLLSEAIIRRRQELRRERRRQRQVKAA